MKRTAVIAIGRRENQYAREFVEHHLRVGFSTVIIADNNREGEERFKDVLQPFIDKGQVIIEDFRNRRAYQLRAYNALYEKYSDRFDWLAFFDFDEHLVLADGISLRDILSDDDDMVLVNWRCFGDNGLVKNDRRPLAERFTEPLPHPLFVQYADQAENDHVKSILRTGLGFKFTENPHTVIGVSPFRPYNPKAKALLNHYVTKTAEEWADKMRRGTPDRYYQDFLRDYRDRFFKYNEQTTEKEKYMTEPNDRTVAIVHYNTPELTEAAILSLRKHGGENYKVVIFDNSDERPWKKRMKGVRRIDNTKGQYIDFEKELDKYPNKTDHGIWGKCVYGSVKHAMSVQCLFDLLPDGFLLMDSDILIRENVDFMFWPGQCCVGHIQTAEKSRNLYGIDRLVPFLCYINVPMCRECGINYFDPKRTYGLLPSKTDKNNWYDTGASFLEDVRSHRNGACGKRIDIRPLMVHIQSGSWRNSDLKYQADWLNQYRDLWEMEETGKAANAGKPETAKSKNRKE